MTIGNNIRHYRLLAGLTQRELGELSDTSERTIQQYESEKRQPRLEQLARIAKVLNVTSADILGWEEDKAKEKLSKENMTLSAKVASSNELKQIVQYCLKLNDKGIAKVLQDLEDLTCIDKYMK